MTGGSATGAPKANWNMAIAASVAFHAVAVGALLFFSGSLSRKAAPDAAHPAVPASETPHAEAEPVTPAETAGSAQGAPTTPSATTTASTAAQARQTGAAQTPAPARQSGAANAANPADAGAAAEGETTLYTVQPGDTLTRIARKHDCRISQIVALNGFSADKRLSIGEKIKVPAAARPDAP